jgi:hypothetical protein
LRGAVWLLLLKQATWTDLGSDLVGTTGFPQLLASGTLQPGLQVKASLANAKPSALSFLVVGFSSLNAPFKGGVMVPDIDLGFVITTDFSGNVSFGGPWPIGVPTGFLTYYQWWVVDPIGPQGFAASNAISGTAP